MVKKTLNAKINRGCFLDSEIKKMTKELKGIKEELKDEAYDNGLKVLQTTKAIATFAETSKTTFTETPQKIYNGLKNKADILKIAALGIPLCRKFFSSREFNKITSISNDSHGKISFKGK